MRILATAAFVWTSASLGIALVLGRVLRALSPAPSVDDWSDERITDEFMALVAELDWTVR